MLLSDIRNYFNLPYCKSSMGNMDHNNKVFITNGQNSINKNIINQYIFMI